MAGTRGFPPVRRLLCPFFRLQGKITLTYTLFTIGAILLLECVLVVAGAFFLRGARHSRQAFIANLQAVAAKVGAHLSEDPQGGLELAAILRHEGEVPQRGPLIGAIGARRVYRPSIPAMAVVDPGGRILAVTPKSLTGIELTELCSGSPAAEALLRAALDGEDDPTRLIERGPDGSVIAAVPLRGGDTGVIGALLYTAPKPPGLSGLLLTILNWRNAARVTIIAGLVGAVFGIVTARWLTRRLRALARVTDAWGRGEFSVRVPDTAKDEFGSLARQMNAMAAQMESLLCTRERLAVMEERNRLARDLHDSVTQAIYSTTLYAKAAARQLAAGDRDMARRHLEDLENSAQQALLEMRLLVHELRPLELGTEGLVAALQARLDAVEGRAGLETDLRVEGEPRLTAEREEGLYRIAQEALNNALKHARPRRVSVRLRQEASKLTMEISDDGRGFVPDDPARSGGMGLRGMRERAARLGGRLWLESEPAGGTTVRVEVAT